MYKELLSMFDNYQDIVYLIDIEDDTIVYVNKACCKTMGASSEYDLIGHKCYEGLRGFTKTCDDCNSSSLCVNKYIVRNLANPLTHKFYSARETLIEENGKKYRLTIAVDLGYEVHQFGRIVQMMTISRIISMAQNTALEEKDPDKAITQMMKYLGEHLESDRVYIFEEFEDGSCSNTYEWCAEGVTPEKDKLQNIPATTMKPWYDELDQRKNILIRDMKQYEKDHPSLSAILKAQDIQTLVVGPLFLHGKRIGYYGVDNPPYKDMDYISSTYDILGGFISSLIAMRDIQRELDEKNK